LRARTAKLHEASTDSDAIALGGDLSLVWRARTISIDREHNSGKQAVVELSHDEVRRIAELAKLALTDEEVALYAGQLSKILDYFARLQEVDTSQIPPTASVLPLKNVMRADEVGTPLTPQQVTANAQDKLGDQFRVSAVLEE
jgi:aspartyl-tRNA(Asn)/glutamyl-tRNA(Gln) amidotransferase subunit C